MRFQQQKIKHRWLQNPQKMMQAQSPSSYAIEWQAMGGGPMASKRQLDPTFPVVLRGRMTQSEYSQLIDELNQFIIANNINPMFFCCSVMCWPCTCCIPLCILMQKGKKIELQFHAILRRKNQELSSRGLQLVLRKRVTGHGKHRHTESWVEISIGPPDASFTGVDGVCIQQPMMMAGMPAQMGGPAQPMMYGGVPQMQMQPMQAQSYQQQQMPAAAPPAGNQFIMPPVYQAPAQPKQDYEKPAL
eukprot:gnl/Trimastix_PCT/1523.p1 GENE.gnl/Trimastix_PCT/1523~~gnl/Trimastix_PCT/1523.p1  ORF type:complete len:263 (+),score=31.82 gnl/Trimastix_PCT/1523:57-791(+)